MPACPQRVVIRARRLIALEADPRPVIERVTKTPLPRRPHMDEERPFPAALGDRGGPGVRAERGISRSPKGPVASVSIVAVTILPTPGKDRRISTSRCSRGSSSRDAAVASRSRTRSIRRSVVVRCSWTSRTCGTSEAMRRATASGTPAATVRRGWRSAATTSSAVRRRMRCARNAGAKRRRGIVAHRHGIRRLGQDAPEPRLVRRGTQGQPGRVDAIELIAQAIGQADFLDLQLLDDPTQFAQLDDLRVIRAFTRRNARRSVRRLSANTCASRPSSLAPATVNRSRNRSSCFGLIAKALEAQGRGRSRQGGRVRRPWSSQRQHRLWKLPEPRTPRTRPPLLGKRTRARFPQLPQDFPSLSDTREKLILKWYKEQRLTDG